MTVEEFLENIEQCIIKSAKEHEKMEGFGSIARNPYSRCITSAYGIGFLDGAEWMKDEFVKFLNKTNGK